MKTRRFLSVLFATTLLLGCSKGENIVPIMDNNFFTGFYHPENRVQSATVASHIVGVECGDQEIPDRPAVLFHWSKEHLDSVIHYTDEATPVTIRYQYDGQGRLVRVERDATYGNTCTLQYEGKHLVSITQNVGGWSLEHSFTYTDSDYPSAYIEHCESQYVEYTDTYSLRWRDGNLVSAVCGPENDNYTLDSITYSYDTRVNPFCGFFFPNALREFGIVHAPTFISRNNPVSITYHTESGPVQNLYYSLSYQFDNGVMQRAVRDYDNMFWCHITDTYTFHY